MKAEFIWTKRQLLKDGFTIKSIHDLDNRVNFNVIKDKFPLLISIPANVSNIKLYYKLAVTDLFDIVVLTDKRKQALQKLNK